MKRLHDYYVFDKMTEKMIGVVPAVNESVARKSIFNGLKPLFEKNLIDMNDIVVFKMDFEYPSYETYFEIVHGYLEANGDKSYPIYTDVTDTVLDTHAFVNDNKAEVKNEKENG